jgi:hypothetical protein
MTVRDAPELDAVDRARRDRRLPRARLVRFDFAPLYNRFGEIVRAAEILGKIVASREWDDPRFKARAKVT